MLDALLDKQARLQMENGSMSDKIAKEVAVALAAVDAHCSAQYSQKEETDRIARENAQWKFEQQMVSANTFATPLMSVPEGSMLHGASHAEHSLPPRQVSSSPGQGPPPAGVPGGSDGPGEGDKDKKKSKKNRRASKPGGDGDGPPGDDDGDDSPDSDSSDSTDTDDVGGAKQLA